MAVFPFSLVLTAMNIKAKPMASESVPSFDRAGIIWTNWTVTVTKMVNELI